MKKILIIDDDLEDQEMLSDLIKDLGKEPEFTYAEDGIVGLEKLAAEEYTPDFIFLDINMPRMNGQEFLAEFNTLHRLQSVPVIIYSTSVDDYVIEHFKKLGVNLFISKSHNLKAVSSEISAVFAAH